MVGMPTRFIKESCRTSKNLHAVADFSERVFWRLLTTADDYGRCLACPAIVKSHCFPLQERLSNTRIIQALQDLAKHKLLVLYQVDDREYAEFVTFEKHQGPPRAKSSKYPPASACMQMLASADHSASPPDTDTNLSSLPPSSDLRSKSDSKKQGNRHKDVSPIPDDWLPNESHKKLASARGLDLPIEAAHFRGKAGELGWQTKDWNQKFTNWMLQEIKFRQRRPT